MLHINQIYSIRVGHFFLKTLISFWTFLFVLDVQYVLIPYFKYSTFFFRTPLHICHLIPWSWLHSNQFCPSFWIYFGPDLKYNFYPRTSILFYPSCPRFWIHFACPIFEHVMIIPVQDFDYILTILVPDLNTLWPFLSQLHRSGVFILDGSDNQSIYTDFRVSKR